MADSDRLQRLSKILNDASPSPRFDRIQRLTRELDDRSGLEPDELDGVTLRLLLDEYANALAHFRAVARDCEGKVTDVRAALKDVRRFVPPQEPTPKQSV